MATLGTKLVATNGAWATVALTPNNQRAFILDAFTAPAPGFVIRLGAFARRLTGATGVPYVWLGLYQLDTAGNPDVLLAYTDRLPVTVSSSGGDVSGLLATPTGGTSAQLDAGARFAIGVKVEGEAVEFAALDATTHWQRTVGTSGVPPTNPFAAGSTVTAPAFTFYAEFDENDPPTADQDAPLVGAVVNTTTPTFQGSFIDSDSPAPAADKLSAYAIEVRQQSTLAVLWGGVGATFPADVNERAAAAFTRTYAGSALSSGGTVYEWRAAVADDCDVWSAWTPWSAFSINALGQVDTATDGTPNTKIDTASGLIDWTARWFHPTALATNAVQVRVLRGNQILRTGTEVVQTVASSAVPGTLFTVQDTAAGIGTLEPGLYRYQVRGRATDNQWSPWSEERAFSINSPPTRPSNLLPPSGATSTSRPLLEWLVDDPDDDDVFGVDDDSQVGIYQVVGGVLSLVGAFTTSNYDSATGRGYLQTTATHLPVTGTYAWYVLGRDLSAGSLGLGLRSTLQYLTYAAGPVVTITAPTNDQVLATSVPTISFSVASGTITRYQVGIYPQGTDTPDVSPLVRTGGVPLAPTPALPLKQSAEIPLTPPATTASFTIPAGWLVNGGSYDVVVSVWDAGNVQGTSLRRPFSVVYTQPLPPNNYAASAGLARFDAPLAPSTVLLSWDPSQYPPGEFAGYVIRRRLVTQDRSLATVLRTLTAPGQIRWTDYWAPSNTQLVYGLSQLRRIGAEVLESPVVEATFTLHRTIPILCSAYDAATLRFPLMWLSNGLGGAKTRPEASYVTWGSEGKPTAITTPARYAKRTVDITVRLRSDDRGHLYEHVAALEALVDSGHPLALLPERPEEQMWCKARITWKRGNPGVRTYAIALEEIDFTPGTQGGS